MPSAKTFFSDRPIAYHPILAKVCGSVTAALFLSQIAYWSDKGASRDGWIWKTQAEMEDETGLSRSEQETARKKLVALGVLKEERRGVPARMWYLVDWNTLTDLIDKYEQTRLQDSRNLDEAKPANYSEITTENTAVVETATMPLEKTTYPERGESFVRPFDNLELGEESPAEKEITQIIFGLGWKERMEIREFAENDVGLESLRQALKDFRAKVETGEYRANWGTLKKFWGNTLSTNKLRAPIGNVPRENVPIVNMQAVVLQ